jgi:hypothetical protein
MSEQEFWQEWQRLEDTRRAILTEAQAAHEAADWGRIIELGHCAAAYWNDVGAIHRAAENLGLIAQLSADVLMGAFD